SLGIDHLLEEFVEQGKVELVETPTEALLPFKYIINGTLQAANWKVDLELNPTVYPSGSGLENIVKVVPGDRSSSFVFILPKEYEFNHQEYKYLRFKVYAADKASYAGSFAAKFLRSCPRLVKFRFSFNTDCS